MNCFDLLTQHYFWQSVCESRTKKLIFLFSQSDKFRLRLYYPWVNETNLATYLWEHSLEIVPHVWQRQQQQKQSTASTLVYTGWPNCPFPLLGTHSHALCKYFPSSVSLAGVFRVFARQKNESVWGRIEQRRNILSLKNIFSFYFSLRQKSLSTPRSGVQKEAIEKIYLSFNIRQKFERHSVMSVICVVNKKEVQFTYTLALSANALAHEVDAILFHQ